MRVWDVHPGYLNRQSLLGEHRELHAVVSIIVNRKKGYSRHPETIRWVGFGWALRQRHRQLVAEMALRGFVCKTPVSARSGRGKWPIVYIDDPADQFRLLAGKYAGREQGRIPLPHNVQQLWRNHKYSVLARDQELYRRIGRELADKRQDFDGFAKLLTGLLRQKPVPGGLQNALQHMWGYVSEFPPDIKRYVSDWSPQRLLREIQGRAVVNDVQYLRESTALSDLMV